MSFINKSLKESVPPRDADAMEDAQIQAYIQLLLKNEGFGVRLPIPLRGKALPSAEDYQASHRIWSKTLDILRVMGMTASGIEEQLTITVEGKNDY